MTTSIPASQGRSPLVGYHERLRQEKRQAALEAAFELFAEQGYAVTTLQQIAARAGISTSTLFKHFPSKAEVFEAMVLEVWRPGADQPPSPDTDDIASGLASVGHALATMVSQPRTIAFYRVFIEAVPAFPELGRVMYERGKLAYIGHIEAFLTTCLAGCRVRPDTIATISSQFLAMITDRVFWPRILVPDLTVSDDERRDAVIEAVATVRTRLGV